MFIVSFLVVLSIVLMTFVLGGSLNIYFNLPSLIIVLIPAIVAPFVVQQKRDVLTAFSLLVKSVKPAEHSRQNKGQYRQTFEIIEKVAMLMGWFGVISGAIAIASNVRAGDFSQVFGPAFAVMMLTLLYAVIIKVICYFAVLRVEAVSNRANA